jgi:hypothetical protein
VGASRSHVCMCVMNRVHIVHIVAVASICVPGVYALSLAKCVRWCSDSGAVVTSFFLSLALRHLSQYPCDHTRKQSVRLAYPRAGQTSIRAVDELRVLLSLTSFCRTALYASQHPKKEWANN